MTGPTETSEGKDWGVIYLAMGGPESLAEVRPFLERMFSDPDLMDLGLPRMLHRPAAKMMAALLASRSRAKYARVGGGSPLVAHTRSQAEALERALDADGSPVRAVVEPAFRYTEPGSIDALRRLAERGATRILALTGYPQASRVTSGSSISDLKAAAEQTGLPVWQAGSYPELEGFIDAMAQRAGDALTALRSTGCAKPALLMTAHSVPERLVAGGDPYVEEVNRTARALARRFPETPYRLSFQSRSRGPSSWHGRTPERVLAELAEQGFEGVCVVPLSFICEHLETLYDLDLVLKEHAARLGMALSRALTVGTASDFINGLAGLVNDRISDIDRGGNTTGGRTARGGGK